MPQVKMYRAGLEKDAPNIGDTAEVSEDRAEFLVVGGYATYTSLGEAKHLPPVGGQRLQGAVVGVEFDGDTKQVQTAAQEREAPQ